MILWFDLALIVVHISVKIFQGAVFPHEDATVIFALSWKIRVQRILQPSEGIYRNVVGKNKPWNFG